MTAFDWVLLALIGIFAVWGVYTGFSKQVTRWAAVIAAFVAAYAAGDGAGQLLTEQFQLSITVGVVLATVLIFLVTWLLVRLLLTIALRRLVMGKSNRRKWLDKSLGFVLGGTKAALVAWLGISAAVLLNFISLPTQDSILLQWAMQKNALKYLQFSDVDDLMEVTKLYSNPRIVQKLKNDVDFTSLLDDFRFRKILKHESLQRALKEGDSFQWLKNNNVMELLRDPQMNHHVGKIKQRNNL